MPAKKITKKVWNCPLTSTPKSAKVQIDLSKIERGQNHDAPPRRTILSLLLLENKVKVHCAAV
jgi:hypothetical protein